MCAAHGDRAAIGVDVDAQGSSSFRKGGSIPRFPDEPGEKEGVRVHSALFLFLSHVLSPRYSTLFSFNKTI